MRSTRDGGRSGFEGSRHLVLVRGGLEERHASAEDGEWQSFCARIGWQSPNEGAGAERTLPDDFEDRVLCRILAEPEKSSEPAYEESVHASWIPSGSNGPVSRYRERTDRKRSGSTASTALLVAAFVGLAAAALLPLLTRPPPGASPRPDPAAQQRGPERQPDTTPAPPTDSANPERRRAPAKPDATENARAPRTEPPGSPVARRARGRNHTGGRESRAGGVARSANAGAADAAEHTPSASVVESQASDAGYATVSARTPTPLFVAERSWSEPSPRAWTEPTEGRGVTRASWSLSPEESRWYGASLPPPGQPGDVHGGRGIGVMAQVDISRALVALETSRTAIR